MISRIQNECRLKDCIRYEIEEIQPDDGHKINVEVDKKLTHRDYVGIKVDDYYNGLHIGKTPKSVDFVVVVKNSRASFTMYIIEFKDVSSQEGLKIRDIQDKFTTTINDFLSERFKDIFLDDKYNYKDIQLYLVSDAYGLAGKAESYEKYREIQEKLDKKDSLKVDKRLGEKVYKFRNRLLRIKYEIPPNPIIHKTT